MIQLTPAGPRVVKDRQWLAQQREFTQRQCVVLRGFVDGALLRRLARLAETGEYVARENGPPGIVLARELTMRQDQPLALAFDMLLNHRRVFEAIAELTGAAAELRRFIGRCQRRVPDRGHFSRWHDDCGKGRLYGLNVGLSPPSVRADRDPGGVFVIRCRETKDILQTIPMLAPGDARLFRIHRALEHKVSLVNELYCGYAGWFVGGDKHRRYQEVMGERIAGRAVRSSLAAHHSPPAAALTS